MREEALIPSRRRARPGVPQLEGRRAAPGIEPAPRALQLEGSCRDRRARHDPRCAARHAVIRRSPPPAPAAAHVAAQDEGPRLQEANDSGIVKPFLRRSNS
jgi:hypothetical protein